MGKRRRAARDPWERERGREARKKGGKGPWDRDGGRNL